MGKVSGSEEESKLRITMDGYREVGHVTLSLGAPLDKVQGG